MPALLLVLAVLGCSGASGPSAPPPPDAPVLLAVAWKCAQTRYGGHGIGGSPLVREGAQLVRDGRSARVRFEEAHPTSPPSGLDLVLSPDGRRCAADVAE